MEPSIRVLFVDPYPSRREGFEAVLRGAPSTEVRGARDAAGAIELLAGWRPDVILAFTSLVEGYRDELLDRLRERPETASIPVIALHRGDSDEDIGAPFPPGVVATLPVPCYELQLLDEVRRAAGRAL